MKINVLKKFFLLVALLTMLIMPQSSNASTFELALGGWYIMPSFSLSAFGYSFNVPGVDAFKFIARAKLEHPIPALPNISAIYVPLGSGMSQIDVALYYGIPGLDTATAGLLNIHLGLDAKIFTFPTILVANTGIPSALPLPMIYLDLVLSPPSLPLFVDLEMRYLPNIIYGITAFDMTARAKYNIIKYAFVGAGYRYQTMGTSYSGVTTTIKFHGPFVEAGVSI
jgi:outer membrane protein